MGLAWAATAAKPMQTAATEAIRNFFANFFAITTPQKLMFMKSTQAIRSKRS
jgi:hypothetical protein